MRRDPLRDLLAQWAGREPDETAEAGSAWLRQCQRELQAAARRRLPGQGRHALRWLVQRPGQVLMSATHVDVRFSLAAHPLALRLAGLDRDPGWLPAGGRVIVFRFD